MDRKEVAKRFSEGALKISGNKIVSITLFGSVAEGVDTEDSDIDILVIADADQNISGDLYNVAADFVIRYSELPSILVYQLNNMSEFAKKLYKKELYCMNEVKARLRKSMRYREMAWHDCRGGFCEDAVSYAYYAMSHATKTFPTLDDISPKTHKGVILQLGKYVKLGKLGKDEVRSITHLTVRLGCDYDIEAVLGKEEVGELINEAEHFVDRIERAIGGV